MLSSLTIYAHMHMHTHTHTHTHTRTHTHARTRTHTHTHIHRKVKALYNNIGDDADELTFNKDDILVVKEQINEEWLICTTGNRSGIVPFSYVQAV